MGGWSRAGGGGLARSAATQGGVAIWHGWGLNSAACTFSLESTGSYNLL